MVTTASAQEEGLFQDSKELKVN